MSPVHKVWPKPSCKAQWNGEEDKADRGGGVKTTSGNGQAWSSPSPRGQRRTGENGGNWLRNHLWCPNDPRGQEIHDESVLMADSLQTRILEDWWSVPGCLLVAVESDSWCAHPTALWTGEGLPPASFLCDFMPISLNLRAQAVKVWGLLLPWLTVDSRRCKLSSPGLCYAFSEYHNHAFLLLTRWRRRLWACVSLPSLRRGQPNATAPEARWTLSWAGWLS